MDEVLFHASQRLDALQIRLSCGLQNFRSLLQAYSDIIQHAAVEAINSPHGVSLQHGLHNIWARILGLGDDVKRIANREYIYDVHSRFLRFLASEVYGTNIYYGCAWFMVGGVLGFTIGLSWQKPPQSIQRMKGVACSNYGGIDAVQFLDDLPVPSIRKSDEVMIQVKAASVDAVDILICSGYGRVLRRQLNKYNANITCEFPVVLGRDCSGIVTDIGQNVKQFDIGDEVWFSIPHWLSGTLAEYVITKESLIAKKPKGIRFEVAASVPYSGMIAWRAVVLQAHLNSVTASGRRVLVHSGCTAVGVIIIQLAHLWGAHVTVTCPQRAIPVAQALGADNIVCDQQPDFLKQLLELYRFDVVFNTVGQVADNLCWKLCKSNGIVVTSVASPIPSDKYGTIFGSLYSIWIRLVCFFRTCVGASAWSTTDLPPIFLDELGKLIDSGSLQPVVDKIFSPQDAELAFQHSDSSDAIGKTIIRFRNPPQTSRAMRRSSSQRCYTMENPLLHRKKSAKKVKHISRKASN